MGLAFDRSNFDEVGRCQAIRHRQNWPGDGNLIVAARKRVNDFGRSVVNWREPPAEFNQGR